MNWEAWVTPLALLGGGFTIGLALEWFGVRRLRIWAAGTTSRGDDLLAAGLRGMPILWSTLIALHLALTVAPVSPELRVIGHRVLVVGIVISATLLVMRVLTGVIGIRAGEDGRGATIFANIARIAVLVVGVLVAFQTLGIQVAPILTALGVGGLAVALALQPTLSNLFSGIQILMTRKINPGDFIRLSSGEEGFVTDISWRETTIRTLPNNLVMIPNANLATSQVTNYSLPEPEIGFAVTISVAHGSDLGAVKAALLEEAAAVQSADASAVAGFVPAVLIGGISESAVELLIVLRTKDFTGQGGMKSALYERVLARLARDGIQLPVPTRTIIHRGDPRLPPSPVDEGERAVAAPGSAPV